MKQGISIERTYDLHDRLVVRILKRRGRLTLEEVSDLLRLEGGGEWSGWYAVLLNCTEGTIGGNGLYDSEDPKGDAVDLYEINEGDDCPKPYHHLRLRHLRILRQCHPALYRRGARKAPRAPHRLHSSRPGTGEKESNRKRMDGFGHRGDLQTPPTG